MKIFALVGKPNVGKSTLFNRLARKRIAIVNKTPGVTRDRNTEIINFKGFNFILIDTGGFEPKSKEIIPQKMKEQSQLAVEEADGIIFLLDQESGWTGQDQDIFDYLRRSHKPIYFTVNKVDNPKHELRVSEFYESGAEEVFSISGEHGLGIVDLLEHISEDFPEINLAETDQNDETDLLSVAIVGRQNAGKSSLTNHFLGKNQQIVDATPGTTRDPVDNICKFHGDSIRLIDTAGIKRKSRVSLLIDKYSMIAAIKSIERADVALLMIDATEGIVEQDMRIAGYIVDRGKALVIVINKWDLIEKDNKTLEKMREEVYLQMPFVAFAPIVFVSAKSGQRVQSVLEKVKDVYQQYTKRIQTSDLNNIIQIITERHTPPVKSGRATKIFYASQVSVKPPTFAIISNNPKAINTSYQRYVMKQFRHYFNFEGTPLKIFWREKSKKNKLEE